MIKILKSFVYSTIGLSVLFVPLTAQAGQISDREIHQEKRIFQGVKSGELNRREFVRLERREASINATRRHFIQSGNGLQPWERKVLDKRLDNLSQDIYQNKHD